MTFIPAPPAKHSCNPPSGPLNRYYDPDTLWQCHDCQRWWFARDGEQVQGRVVWCQHSIFHPVRWWHRKLRKRIQDKGVMDWGGNLVANLVIPPQATVTTRVPQHYRRRT
jgi:hypothetical protein